VRDHVVVAAADKHDDEHKDGNQRNGFIIFCYHMEFILEIDGNCLPDNI
jgi:hypothetical protein